MNSKSKTRHFSPVVMIEGKENHISQNRQPILEPYQKPSDSSRDLRALATETTGKLDVLGLDGDTLGVDSAEVSVLKERHKVSLNGLLESTDGRRLEAEVGLEILSNFTNKTLEGQLADQKLGRFLVTTDFTESDGTLMCY